MLGTLRLLLALLVAISHADVRWWGMNPGVIAVVGFYIISGYVMAGLVQRHYPALHLAPRFYLDRALRIYPQYLLYALLTLLWVLASHPSVYFVSAPVDATALLNNLLIVPLNFYMFNGSDRFTLLPPAWSLGAEVLFYLLAPLLLLLPRLFAAAFALSLAVYGAALAGWINTEWYGYRLLPGVLWFFLLGALLARGRRLALNVGIGAIAALAALHFAGNLRQPYHLETLLGLLFGAVLVQWLGTRARTRWDDFAGDLSYGVFLNHFLILWVVYPRGVVLVQLPVFLGVSMLLAWLSQTTLERPLLRLRKHLRPRPS